MNGYTLASTFRHGDLVCAALVAVTGYGRAEDVSRSRRAGVDHHLVKPVDLAARRRLLSERLDDIYVM